MMQSVLHIHSGYLNRLSRVTSFTSLKSFGNFVRLAKGSQANRSSTLSPRCAALASPPRKGPQRARRAPQTQQQPDHRCDYFWLSAGATDRKAAHNLLGRCLCIYKLQLPSPRCRDSSLP